MAIMHTTMTGIVNSDIEIIKDEHENDYCCAFTMLVKERGQRIQFSVYSDDKDIIKKSKDKLDKGCAVLVKGVMDISFHNPPQNINSDNKSSYFPSVITSNMAIVCKEILILNPKEQEVGKLIPITVVQKQTAVVFQFDKELPF